MNTLLTELSNENPSRKVSPLLGFGIFLIPFIFAWFLLREGHSKRARILGFGWFAITMLIAFAS